MSHLRQPAWGESLFGLQHPRRVEQFRRSGVSVNRPGLWRRFKEAIVYTTMWYWLSG